MATNSEPTRELVGAAVSRGLDYLLVVSTVMLALALFYPPLRGETLFLVGAPLAVAVSGAFLGAVLSGYRGE